MLSIKTQDGWLPLNGYSDYYIEKTKDGTEVLSFDISKSNPLFEKIKSEVLIRSDENEYIITGINLPSVTATITCGLNMHEWKQGFYFKSSDIPALATKLLVDVLEYIKPTGWSILNAHIRDIKRTPDNEKCNGYDILMRCRDLYNVWFDIDCKSKTIYVVDPNDVTDTGAYVTPELNMTGISYKESSSERLTRLYCYGKEDITFADINGGNPYVDCFDYTSDILVGSWSDQRYDVKENLLADATKKIKQLAIPIGSYTIDVKDLAEIDDRYTYINLALRHAVHCIIDPDKGIELTHRVVKVRWYPDEPGKKVVTLSNEPQKLQDKINNVISAVGEDGQKITGSILKQAQETAALLINEFATKGHKYETANETYFLDALPKEKAKFVMRQNLGGIAFSQSGWAGPYISAWTIDGRFNADFITGGTIKGIRITNGNNFNVDENGNVTAANANISGRITATSGTIGGWIIQESELVKTFTYNVPRDYTTADTERIKEIIMEGITPSEQELNRYDLSFDGYIASNDYAIVKNVMAGMHSYIWTITIKFAPLDARRAFSISIDRGNGSVKTEYASIGGISINRMANIESSLRDYNARLIKLESKLGL